MKFKRVVILLLIICMAVMMFSCSGSETADNKSSESNKETEVELPVATYVGSHATSNAMGDVVSGHLINVFADGSVKIYYGIKAGMQGLHCGVYDGKLENGVVTYTFTKSEADSSSAAEFELPDNAESFKAKVFCLASYPNSSGGGIDYVKIAPMIPDESAEYVFMGSKVNDDGKFGFCIELKDGKLRAYASADGKTDTVEGSYSIEYSDLDDIDSFDMLNIKYRPFFTESGDSETGIKFSDTSFISFVPESEGDVLPKLTLATIVNTDGVRDN